MGRIVHIALKCADKASYEKSAKFYAGVFGIYETKTTHERGHYSRHMTDGNIDLALMLYDSEEEKEAKLAGPGARIHHIGLEVEDRASMIAKIEANGGRIFSDRAEGALKYHAPDGTLGEIVGVGRYLKKELSREGRIAHVAMKVKDLDAAAQFYTNVFGFHEVAAHATQLAHTRHLSDGEIDLALTGYTSEHDEDPRLAGDGACIHHWGIEAPDVAEAVAKAVALGGEVIGEAGASAVRVRAPDGNVCEIAMTGAYARGAD